MRRDESSFFHSSTNNSSYLYFFLFFLTKVLLFLFISKSFIYIYVCIKKEPQENWRASEGTSCYQMNDPGKKEKIKKKKRDSHSDVSRSLILFSLFFSSSSSSFDSTRGSRTGNFCPQLKKKKKKTKKNTFFFFVYY